MRPEHVTTIDDQPIEWTTTAPTSNYDLAVLILPWADTYHPDKAKQTRAVVGKPDTYRRYLLRLVEIRWTEDLKFRPTVPFDVLEDTAITARLRLRDGTILEVKGRHAEGVRRWTFAELKMAVCQPKSFVDCLIAAKTTLDLETVAVGPTQTLRPPLHYHRRRAP